MKITKKYATLAKETYEFDQTDISCALRRLAGISDSKEKGRTIQLHWEYDAEFSNLKAILEVTYEHPRETS